MDRQQPDVDQVVNRISQGLVLPNDLGELVLPNSASTYRAPTLSSAIIPHDTVSFDPAGNRDARNPMPGNPMYEPMAFNSMGFNPQANVIPTVTETKNGMTRSYDIFSRLLEDNTIMLASDINDNVAANVVTQLLWLESQDKEKPIKIVLMSPGGSITAGMAIYDTMQLVKPDVNVYIMGQAASMGAVLTAGGEKSYALPGARFMIHQARVGQAPGGTASDLQVFVDELVRVNENMMEILAERTGNDIDKVRADCAKDYFMSAEQAVEYGLVDKIVGNWKDDPSAAAAETLSTETKEEPKDGDK